MDAPINTKDILITKIIKVFANISRLTTSMKFFSSAWSMIWQLDCTSVSLLCPRLSSLNTSSPLAGDDQFLQEVSLRCSPDLGTSYGHSQGSWQVPLLVPCFGLCFHQSQGSFIFCSEAGSFKSWCYHLLAMDAFLQQHLDGSWAPLVSTQRSCLQQLLDGSWAPLVSTQRSCLTQEEKFQLWVPGCLLFSPPFLVHPCR